MGAPMALHLVNAGHTLFVNTRGKLPESIAASSALACASGEEVAAQADLDHSALVRALELMASHEVAEA